VQPGGGATTIGGNLTVSGTGQSSLSSSSALFAVGTSTPTSTNSVGVPQIVAESDLYSSVASIAHNTADGNYGFFLTGKSRGTKASPLIVANGDRVGGYGFIAYDGAAYRTSAEIVGVIDGTPGAADLPTRLSFRVAADGSASPSEQMRLTSAGRLLLGTGGVDSGALLQVGTNTTTSAGGMVFGTDLSLYRGNTGFLILNDSAASDARIGLFNGGTQRALFEAYGVASAVYMGAASAGWATYITSGNQAIALTLDSSQNATFAGKVTAGGAYQDISSGLGALNIRSTSAQTAGYGGTILLSGIYTGTSETAFAGIRGAKENSTDNNTAGALSLWTRTAGGALTERLTISSTGDATFAGTGVNQFAGNLNIKGGLGAHQTAALNLAYEGSSVSQAVAYGADASTLGAFNVVLRKAGTGTGAVTGLGVRDYGIITQGGTAYTPASASATGNAGTISWDASYIYVCTAANTWKRVAIATW
jgi:hypothetical protein